jgi:hypothetical protein
VYFKGRLIRVLLVHISNLEKSIVKRTADAPPHIFYRQIACLSWRCRPAFIGSIDMHQLDWPDLERHGICPVLMENLASVASLLQLAKPVNGDYELVQAGMALAIFCFPPWCQVNRDHAEVEILTAKLPGTANNVLLLLWEVLLISVMCVIAWRILIATSEKLRYGETTFLLQMPSW